MRLYISKYSSLLEPLPRSPTGGCSKGLWFDGQKYCIAGIDETSAADPRLETFKVTGQWLDAYFTGKAPDSVDIGNAAKIFDAKSEEILLPKNLFWRAKAK